MGVGVRREQCQITMKTHNALHNKSGAAPAAPEEMNKTKPPAHRAARSDTQPNFQLLASVFSSRNVQFLFDHVIPAPKCLKFTRQPLLNPRNLKKAKFPLFLTILKAAIFLSRGRDLSRLAYTLSFGWCKKMPF